MVERDVVEFKDVIWEPSSTNTAKFAVHTLSKKVLAEGKTQFSNETNRLGIDLYQVKSDKNTGLIIKKVGVMGSEKIHEFHFAGSGNIFCTIEQESISKMVLNFYLISKS